jgi:organic hydroperoxide reductase OsmC/OhrA
MSDTKTLYTANVHVTGAREGHAKSSDGRLDIKLSTPAAPALAPTRSSFSPRAGRPASRARWAWPPRPRA